jgi:hypothetical protein
LVRQGNIDPKAQETLNGRVHACWINPGLEPTAAEAAPPAAAAAAGTTKPYLRFHRGSLARARPVVVARVKSQRRCLIWLNRCLPLSYAAPQQNELRLSPGDGFEGLLFCPTWLCKLCAPSPLSSPLWCACTLGCGLFLATA